MTKYRIVEVIKNSGHADRKGFWVIEENGFFGWRGIYNNEGPRSKRVQHDSYEEAELYLLEKYTGHGECRVYGNVYTYQPYTYYI
jgi:hypothetical protein